MFSSKKPVNEPIKTEKRAFGNGSAVNRAARGLFLKFIFDSVWNCDINSY
jgi:hypothetical protein